VIGPGHPGVSHALNVLLYALCCALFYRVALELFEERKPGVVWLSLPFVAALWFTAHPLHTEVVANIKSRDELLALAFALASLLASLRARWIAASLCFLAALLSKESAITFLAVIPFSLWCFRTPARPALVRAMPAIGAGALAYLVLRALVLAADAGRSAAPPDLLNDSFLGASTADAYATVVATLGRYLLLLVWPHPLTHDYAPFHIAITSWRSAAPWLSLVVHAGLAALATSALRTRSIPGYAASFYLATISVGSNLLFPVGTFLAERFLFAPSAGAAIGFAWALHAALTRFVPALNRRAALARAAALAVTLVLGALTVLRNPAWRDSYTLFTTDIAVSRDSALANANAADVKLVRASETRDAAERAQLEGEAVAHLETALRIHPRYERALEMLAAAQGRRGDPDASLAALERLFALNPRRGTVAFNAGTILLQHHPERAADAVRYLERAVEIRPQDADAHANLGVAYYKAGDTPRAIASFERAVTLAPARADHRANLDALRAEAGPVRAR
jgi:Tfp pilus assembly protein PilF